MVTGLLDKDTSTVTDVAKTIIFHLAFIFIVDNRLKGLHENDSLKQGWPNVLNVRATYDKLQMFESRKTRTNITHTFLLLHAHFFLQKFVNIFTHH
jgi:hypothetical protein